MMRRNAYMIGAALILLTLGVSLWQRNGNKEPLAPSVPPSADGDMGEPDRNADAVRGNAIVMRHRFFSGTHTWSGTLITPTPCHQVSADAQVMESAPEQIVLSFMVLEPEPGTMCAQVVAEQPFNVTARASAEAKVVGGELNGQPVRIEVVEGGVEFDAPPLGVELVP